jgi:arabinose-5-phosphate isomerase
VTDPRRLAERVLRLEAAGILALVPRLDQTFVRAVDLLHGCRGRVIVAGMGKSGLIGRKIAATLASTGTPAYFLHPAEAVHGDLGLVAPDDVILAISNSGETSELLALLEHLKRLATPIVLLTGNAQSTLARQCDVVLDVSVAEEACPMNLAPTTSTTAVLAIGDALAMVLLDRKGLTPEDYAALHPKGALGWRALFRVADLMHTGGAVPVVHEDTAMKDVVVEMTAKRLGITTVVDEGGRLVGVVTDGDLRRLHLREASVLGLRARDCMTREPKLIRGDDLAAKALEVMEAFAITSLIVVDAVGQPHGMIHMHDILRAKIV